MKNLIILFLFSSFFTAVAVYMLSAANYKTNFIHLPAVLVRNGILPDSSGIEVFEGRTPCNPILLHLNNISSQGCNRIKLRLTLYKDAEKRTPTNFELNVIYVGKGDTRYSNKGKWTIGKGTKSNPDATVFQLTPDKSQINILLLKADDNVLFFLDENRELMVGNEVLSFTLNKREN